MEYPFNSLGYVFSDLRSPLSARIPFPLYVVICFHENNSMKRARVFWVG